MSSDGVGGSVLVGLPAGRLIGRSVSAAVAAHLEHLIAGGQLRPGDRLPPERELAVRLNVSRASLREAMHELAAKRLVERRPGRGSVVRAAPTHVSTLYAAVSDVERQLAHVVELRETIEPRMAGLAALRATAANLIELEAALAPAEVDIDAAESLRLDLRFHQAVAQAAQNSLLVALGTLTSSWTSSTRALSHQTRQARTVSRDGHQQILRAIAARDEPAAIEAMACHLRDVALLTRAAAAPGAAPGAARAAVPAAALGVARAAGSGAAPAAGRSSSATSHRSRAGSGV